MATPPTFEAEYETAWSVVGAGAKTSSVTVATGDVLVICGITESNTYTLATPTGGGLTYTLAQSVVVSNYATCYVWTAVSASSQTFTLSITMAGGTGYWGFNALRFSGSNGVGASSKTNVDGAAPSLGLTTGTDNAAIVVANGDWNAADGGSRTWRTINGITPTSGNGLEATYARDASRATFYAARWNDAGTAGSKTTGLSAPSGQRYSIIAVEVQGTAGGTGATVTPSTVAATVTVPASTLSTGSTVSPTQVAAAVATPAPTVRIHSTITPAAVALAAAVPAAAQSTGSTATPATVPAAAAVPGVSVTAGGSATVVPSPVAATAAVPAPSLSTGSTPTPAAVAAAASVPARIISGGALATPTPVAAVAAVPAGSPGAGSTVSPVSVATAATIPLPTVAGTSGALVLAQLVAATATVWAPQVNPSGIVQRPFTGVTSRPSTGTVTRPFTGIVSRP